MANKVQTNHKTKQDENKSFLETQMDRLQGRLQPIGVALVTVVVLTILVIGANAGQVDFASVEFEKAESLSGGTAVGKDSDASDGEFLVFGVDGSNEQADVSDTNPNPPEESVDPVQDNTDDPDPEPTDAVPNARGGFPNASTTGIRASGLKESDLSASGVSGRWTIKQDGAVIERKIHNGVIVVDADNVTIKDTIVRGTGSKLIENKGRNLRIENTLVEGGNLRTNLKVPSPCDAAIGSGNYTAVRVDVSNCADGFKISADVTILDSYIHNLYADRRSGGSGTHNDGIQQNNNSSMNQLVFRGNSVFLHPCTSNRAFQLGLSKASLYGDYLIENNFFWGSIGVINSEAKDGSSGGGTATVRNNLIAGLPNRGPFSAPNGQSVIYSGSLKKAVSGNKFEDGSSADAGKFKPYTCDGSDSWASDVGQVDLSGAGSDQDSSPSTPSTPTTGSDSSSSDPTTVAPNTGDLGTLIKGFPNGGVVTVPNGTYKVSDVSNFNPSNPLVLVAETEGGVDVVRAANVLGQTDQKFTNSSKVTFVGIDFVNVTVALYGADDFNFYRTTHTYPPQASPVPTRKLCGGERDPTTFIIRNSENIDMFGVRINDVGHDGIKIGNTNDVRIVGSSITDVHHDSLQKATTKADQRSCGHNKAGDIYHHADAIQMSPGGVTNFLFKDSYSDSRLVWQVEGQNGQTIRNVVVEDSVLFNRWTSSTKGVLLNTRVKPTVPDRNSKSVNVTFRDTETYINSSDRLNMHVFTTTKRNGVSIDPLVNLTRDNHRLFKGRPSGATPSQTWLNQNGFDGWGCFVANDLGYNQYDSFCN